jgi:hypothetical protein
MTNLSQRNNGEEAEAETKSSIPIQMMRNEAERDENKENIQV